MDSWWLSRAEAWSWEASATGRVPVEALFAFAVRGDDPGGRMSALSTAVGTLLSLGRVLDPVDTRVATLRALAQAHEDSGPDLRVGVPPLLWARVRSALHLPDLESHLLPADRRPGTLARGVRRGAWEAWWGWSEAPGAAFDGELWAWGVVRVRAGIPDAAPPARAAWGARNVPHPALSAALARTPVARRPALDRGPGHLLACVADALAALARQPVDGLPAVRAVLPSTLSVAWVTAWLPVVARSASWARSPRGTVTPPTAAPSWSFGVPFLARHPRTQAALLAVDRVAQETLSAGDMRLLTRRLGLAGEPALLARCADALEAARSVDAPIRRGAPDPVEELAAAVRASPTLDAFAVAWADVVRGPGVAVREVGRAQRATWREDGAVAVADSSPDGHRLVIVDGDGEQGLRAPDVRVRDLGWYGPDRALLVHTEDGRLAAAPPGAVVARKLKAARVEAFTVDGAALYTLEDGYLCLRGGLADGPVPLGPARGSRLAAAGGWVAWAEPDGQVWVVPAGRPTGAAERVGVFPGVEVLTLSEEGRLLIGGFTLVVRGPDGLCRTLPRQRHARVTAASWCGSRLAVGDLTGVIEVWRDGQPERDLEGHTGAVLALGWDAEGAQLCSVATDGTLRTWETSPEDPLVTRIRAAFEGLLATPVTDRVIARYVADECWSRWTDPLFLPEEP